MIRITVELVPTGNEARKHTIGVLTISNIGGDKAIAQYAVVEHLASDYLATSRGTTKPIKRGDLFPWLAAVLSDIYKGKL